MKNKTLSHRSSFWLKPFARTSKKETHIIGLGGAGCNIAKYFYERGFEGSYSCLSNAERLDLPANFLFTEHHIYSREKRLQLMINKIKWDEECTMPDLDRIIPKSVEKRLKGNYRFILLVGLGGLTGSYLVKQLADFLKEKNKEFAIICTTPFNFEGEFTNGYANLIKDELSVLPYFYCFSNEGLREKYGNLTMRKVFDYASEEMWIKYNTYNSVKE